MCIDLSLSLSPFFMAGLLRRVWSSVSPSLFSPSSSSSSSSPPSAASSSSSCSFDLLPGDILFGVFSLLPPRDLASAALVCKAWLYVASSDALWQDFLISSSGITSWPFVLFAEASLRAGPCFGPVEAKALSFQQLYSARRQQPRSVIIDGGSGYCKYGWSDLDKPRGKFPTFLAFGNLETPMYVSLKDFFAAVFERLETKPSSQPVVISTPICHYDDIEAAVSARKHLRMVTYRVLFDLGVQAVCAVDQAILALYAAKQTSGIVVNIGFQVTSVVPILHGKIMRNAGVEVVGQGALNVTAFLCELMQLSHIPFDNIGTVKVLKEKLCYVALDYEVELSKNTEACCRVENVGDFRLNHERFKACEILYRPYLGGLQTMSLQQAVSLCIEHCAQITTDKSTWYRTIVLCGGTACLPGMAERLKKEVCKLLSHRLSEHLVVIPPQHGPESVWFGAKLLGNLSTFQKEWCITNKQFQWYGQSILDKKALDDG